MAARPRHRTPGGLLRWLAAADPGGAEEDAGVGNVADADSSSSWATSRRYSATIASHFRCRARAANSLLVGLEGVFGVDPLLVGPAPTLPAERDLLSEWYGSLCLFPMDVPLSSRDRRCDSYFFPVSSGSGFSFAFLYPLMFIIIIKRGIFIPLGVF